jgi:hypothetical protein
MRTLYQGLAHFAGFMCGVLLTLALLTAPSARADEGEDGFTKCSPGNPECAVYLTQGDCEPGFNNKCNNSHQACGCRWRPVSAGVNKCICQNVTGG